MNSTNNPTSSVKNDISPSRWLIHDPQVRMVRAQEKRVIALKFLALERYVSVANLAERLDVGYAAAHTLLKRFCEEGLTTSSQFFVRAERSVKRVVLHGLTAQGVALSKCHLDSLNRNSGSIWEASKVNATGIPHRLAIQSARARCEKSGWSEWCNAGELMEFGWPKIPDARARSPDGKLVGIEVERIVKTPKRYQSIIGAHVVQMKQEHWHTVAYICPDIRILKHMLDLFSNLDTMRFESGNGISYKSSVEQRHLDRFSFFTLAEWPYGTPAIPQKKGKAL